MAPERLGEQILRMPRDAYEQKSSLPDETTRLAISRKIFSGLSFLLTSYQVEIDWEKSGPRPTKDSARIDNKVKRRNSTDPMRDIYGARFITEDPRRGWLVSLIQSAYPATPKVFLSGKLSARDYRDPAVRASHIERFNPHMSPLYSALHVNIVFAREDSDILDIGEVQIMTHEELKIYEQTRGDYSK
jgi:hypothetical protein